MDVFTLRPPEGCSLEFSLKSLGAPNPVGDLSSYAKSAIEPSTEVLLYRFLTSGFLSFSTSAIRAWIIPCVDCPVLPGVQQHPGPLYPLNAHRNPMLTAKNVLWGGGGGQITPRTAAQITNI